MLHEMYFVYMAFQKLPIYLLILRLMTEVGIETRTFWILDYYANHYTTTASQRLLFYNFAYLRMETESSLWNTVLSEKQGNG
jgi:thiamine transporter ThiT